MRFSRKIAAQPVDLIDAEILDNELIRGSLIHKKFKHNNLIPCNN